jgi:hypothetical protein
MFNILGHKKDSTSSKGKWLSSIAKKATNTGENVEMNNLKVKMVGWNVN